MNEMDVEPVDLRHEVRQAVQPRFTLAPVVIRRPGIQPVRIIPSGTPSESPVTVSRSGHLVALIRRFRSVSSASEKPTSKGRTR